MLHSYRFKNYYSFRDETEVSFLLSGHAPENQLSFVSPLGFRLSRALSVLGANGSGKTNLLKPLAFLSWFLERSFRAPAEEPIPLSPHFFATEEPTEFEVVFETLGELWRYELKATPKQVLREALYKKTSKLFSYVFIRELQAQGGYEVKQRGFGFNPQEAKKVGKTVSLLSAALQYQVEKVRELIAALSVEANVIAMGRSFMGYDHERDAAQRYGLDQHMALRTSELLHEWDFGLSRVDVRKEKQRGRDNQEQELFNAYGIHSVGGKTAELPLYRESSGTQTAFVLLSRLLPVLERGGVAVIDELENDLHPEMLAPVLDLFFSPKTNPHNAQVVFTCHAVQVLNQLNKGQVMLVEKNENCESQAWRLDSMTGVRADDNLVAKYLAGTYGAVPRL